MITTVLFDMDGTLLPMDYDTFANGYFGIIAKKMAPHGFDPKEVVAAVWSGTKAMVKNDGSVTNERAFWNEAERIYGKEKCALLYRLFEDLYEHEFDACESFCRKDPLIAETVEHIRSLGLRTAVATNPLFPEPTMRKRLMWSGVPAEWFEAITTYENSGFCKPNPGYFTETAGKLGVKPEECLMVGNDMTEDLAARKTGMDVFIVTDCLINKQGTDINTVSHGNWQDLWTYVDRLPR